MWAAVSLASPHDMTLGQQVGVLASTHWIEQFITSGCVDVADRETDEEMKEAEAQGKVRACPSWSSEVTVDSRGQWKVKAKPLPGVRGR